jgi:hypothetical protein
MKITICVGVLNNDNKKYQKNNLFYYYGFNKLFNGT